MAGLAKVGLILSRLEKSLVGATAAVACEGPGGRAWEKSVERTGGGGCESREKRGIASSVAGFDI